MMKTKVNRASRWIVAAVLGSTVNVATFGQTTQQGVVKEYNERMEKTPLGNVEIVISNASSTTSQADGAFTLQFRTLKPGDKVSVRRIEKLGYEIFNKEALEQWFIARDGRPFTVIMCRSDKFRRIRDNYSRVTSASYEKQLKKEEARLAAERRAGKLKEEEYEAALKKLNDEYDQQLENLDNYIDRFARIDLSELSVTEAEILQLVQEGNIDEAISRYEQQHLEEKYKQEVATGRKAQAAIDTLTAIRQQALLSRDSLFATIRRKNETLRLAGGRENFEKIGQSLKDIALADTTYLEAVWEYAEYAQQQAVFYDALAFYSIFIRACNDRQLLAQAKMKQADTYRALKRYEESATGCDQALELARQLYAENPDAYSDLMGQALVSKGTQCYEVNQLREAEQLFAEASTIYAKLSEDGSETHLYTLSKMQNNLGNLYRRMRQFDKSATYLRESLKNAEKLYAANPKKYLFDVASTRNNLGLTYKQLNKLDSCEMCYQQAVEEMGQLYRFNPKAYREVYAKYLSNMGVLYKNLKRFEDAEHYYLLALAQADTLYAQNKEAYAIYLGNTLLNLGNLYNRMKRSNDAKRFLLKALPVMQTLYKRNAKAFCVNLFSNYMSLGIVCTYLEQYEEGEPYFLEAKRLGEELIAANPKAYSMEYYLILKNLGITYEYLERPGEAGEYYVLALQKIEALYAETPAAYESEVISCKYAYADFCKANGMAEKAVRLYGEVLELCRKDEQRYERYVQKAQKALNEIGE